MDSPSNGGGQSLDMMGDVPAAGEGHGIAYRSSEYSTPPAGKSSGVFAATYRPSGDPHPITCSANWIATSLASSLHATLASPLSAWDCTAWRSDPVRSGHRTAPSTGPGDTGMTPSVWSGRNA